MEQCLVSLYFLVLYLSYFIPPIRALHFHLVILFPLTNTRFCSFPYFFPFDAFFASAYTFPIFRTFLLSFSSLSHFFVRYAIFLLSIDGFCPQSSFFPPFFRSVLLALSYFFHCQSYVSPLSRTFSPPAYLTDRRKVRLSRKRNGREKKSRIERKKLRLRGRKKVGLRRKKKGREEKSTTEREKVRLTGRRKVRLKGKENDWEEVELFAIYGSRKKYLFSVVLGKAIRNAPGHVFSYLQ